MVWDLDNEADSRKGLDVRISIFYVPYEANGNIRYPGLPGRYVDFVRDVINPVCVRFVTEKLVSYPICLPACLSLHVLVWHRTQNQRQQARIVHRTRNI